jgi:hypothetical protein
MDLYTRSMGIAARMLLLSALLTCFSTAALGANDITGSVHNRTRGQASAGDEVILIRLDSEMQEEARAKTDEHGTFTLHPQYPDKPYLLRVIHQGVSYDQQVFADNVVSVDIFEAARTVPGITGTIEILRTGTKGNLLHVSDMYEIKNDSRPPLTQAGDQTFEVYLPADAKMDSVFAGGPGTSALMISAAPVPSEPGHYTVDFPLRPGATKFAFNYDLPYDGHAAFQTRRAYSLQQLAVMFPPTMKFSSRSPAFAPLATASNKYQVQAANQLQPGKGPTFEISGAGELPPLGDQARSPARSHSSAPPDPTSSSPGHAALPSLASIDSRSKQTQPRSQSLVLASITSVLLAACVLLVWRTRKARNFFAAQTVAPRTGQSNCSQLNARL